MWIRKPRATRLLALLLSCLMSVGAHYGKHALSALGPLLTEEMDLNKRQFGLIFSFQEIPGMVLPLYAGFLLSLVSPQVAAILLTAMVFLGQVLVAVAASVNRFYLLLLGRLIFGLGDGALVVLQGCIIGVWFGPRKPGESEETPLVGGGSYVGMSTAYGLMLLASRLSTLSALGTPALIATHCPTGVECALGFACGICGLSLIGGIMFFWIFRSSPKNGESTGHSSWRGHLLSVFDCLKVEYFLLLASWMFISAAFFSFVHFAPDIFARRYFMSNVNAGIMSAACLVFAAIISPGLGLCLDHIGHRPDVLILGSFFICTAMLRLTARSSSADVMLAVLLLGLGFAVAPVTLLSSVALISEEENLALALGIFKCAENLGLAITHYIAGYLADLSGSYTPTLCFFAFLGMCAVISSLTLRMRDMKMGAKLSSASRDVSITNPNTEEAAGRNL